MLKSVKEKQPKHGWKNKSIRFLEFEVQSTISHLRYIVTETFQKLILVFLKNVSNQPENF